MPNPSPIVLVADGAGPFNPTFPNGLDINPGDTVSVVLESPAGVTNWYLQIGLVIGNPPVVVPGTGLDELTLTPPPLTGVNPMGLVTGGPTATVTFTFPATNGTTLLFSSTVTGGFGSITTTFALFSPTTGGFRVGATGMGREGSNASGWTSIVNPAIRQIGSGGGGAGGSFVYLPGAAHPGGNVFATFEAAVAAANALNGGVSTIYVVGGGHTPPAVVVGSNLDLTNITLVGFPLFGEVTGPTLLTFQNGSSISNIWAGLSNMTVDSVASGSIQTLFPSGSGTGLALTGFNSFITSSGGTPFFQVNTSRLEITVAGSQFTVGDFSNAVFGLGTGANASITVSSDCTLADNAIKGTGGAVDLNITASATSFITTTLPGVTIQQINLNPPVVYGFLLAGSPNPATVHLDGAHLEAMVNTSTSPSTVFSPAAMGGVYFGQTWRVTDESGLAGTNNITVTASDFRQLENPYIPGTYSSTVVLNTNGISVEWEFVQTNQYKVKSVVASSGGVNVQNNGTPIANNPHTTINLIGITGADAGGGVATFTAQPSIGSIHPRALTATGVAGTQAAGDTADYTARVGTVWAASSGGLRSPIYDPSTFTTGIAPNSTKIGPFIWGYFRNTASVFRFDENDFTVVIVPLTDLAPFPRPNTQSVLPSIAQDASGTIWAIETSTNTLISIQQEPPLITATYAIPNSAKNTLAYDPTHNTLILCQAGGNPGPSPACVFTISTKTFGSDVNVGTYAHEVIQGIVVSGGFAIATSESTDATGSYLHKLNLTTLAQIGSTLNFSPSAGGQPSYPGFFAYLANAGTPKLFFTWAGISFSGGMPVGRIDVNGWTLDTQFIVTGTTAPAGLAINPGDSTLWVADATTNKLYQLTSIAGSIALGSTITLNTTTPNASAFDVLWDVNSANFVVGDTGIDQLIYVDPVGLAINFPADIAGAMTAVVPGPAGSVLTSQGPGKTPNWASGGPLLGDNADALRMGPNRNFIQGSQVNPLTASPAYFTTTLTDGSEGYSGADLVLSERRLLMTGAVTYGSASTTNTATFTPGPLPPGGFVVCTVASTVGFTRGATISITQSSPALSGTFVIYGVTSATTLDLYTLTISGGGSFNPGATVAYAGSTLDGQLVSMETSGQQYGLDFSFPALQTLFTNTHLNNPTALIGVGIINNFFNAVSVFHGGLLSNYIYESIHSTEGDSNMQFDAGAENWTGARACYVYQDNEFNHGAAAEVYWTAPLVNKVYQANIFFDAGDPTSQTFTGETPTGICATGNNTFWVSFTGSGKLRQYKVVPSGAVPHTSVPTFAQIGSDVSLANVVDLLFDGKYLWAASTTGTHGTIYKLDASGNLIDTYTIFQPTSGGVSSRTRMCFDGISVWITLGVGGVMRIFVEGGAGSINDMFFLSTVGHEARGICADRDGTIYVSIFNGTNLTIGAWFPTTGAYPDQRRPRPIVWTLGRFEMPSAFTAINIQPQNDSSTRIFDLDIVATSSGFGGFAAWRKSFAVQDTGVFTLIGSVSDVIPPRLNATANSQGWNVTVTDGSSLSVTLTTGSYTNSSVWTINLTETHTFGGAL